MGKKLIIGGVIILVILGSAFYFLVLQKDKFLLYSIYGDWSKREDYVIEARVENNQVVRNTKFGFSFLIPKQWEISERNIDGRYVFILESPDRIFDTGEKIMERGCEFGIEAFESEVGFVQNAKADIYRLQSDPKISESEGKHLMIVGGYTAVYEKNVVPLAGQESNKSKWLDQVSIPLTDERLLNITPLFSDTNKERCLKDFEAFLAKVQIEGTQELSK